MLRKDISPEFVVYKINNFLNIIKILREYSSTYDFIYIYTLLHDRYNNRSGYDSVVHRSQQ